MKLYIGILVAFLTAVAIEAKMGHPRKMKCLCCPFDNDDDDDDRKLMAGTVPEEGKKTNKMGGKPVDSPRPELYDGDQVNDTPRPELIDAEEGRPGKQGDVDGEGCADRRPRRGGKKGGTRGGRKGRAKAKKARAQRREYFKSLTEDERMALVEEMCEDFDDDMCNGFNAGTCRRNQNSDEEGSD